MANTGFFTGFFKNRLGPFKLIRRYTSPDLESGTDLGRIYEAYNIYTANSALVLIPGEHAPMESQEEWRVRLRCQPSPPYVALEVEKAPSSGRLSQLSGMLGLLGTAVERLEKSEKARAHLTILVMGPLDLLVYMTGRAYRWVRTKRRRTFAVCGLTSLVLLVVALSQIEVDAPRVAPGVAVQATTENRAPMLTDNASGSAAPIAYPLPDKPFSDQAKAPCKTHLDELEINGGCWVELARRPPCLEVQAEYRGKCYLPVSARSRERREPRSIHP
ncbi:hypothetical protein [Archangium sp.]|uniref:hypothetical protein n=1 Tax=Archangium sp. TaxID=1872627 RepID=UPI002D57FC09|nr:hypothetical protein [Archangium sp.]HYO55841.1 hypothetical protein [Archangium sp.]